jgi:UPF0271 protein
MTTSSGTVPTVDLNSDLGESFGVWRLGPDEEMMTHITSANIACGFHAGDPGVMRRTVRLARLKGLAIGAHPGYHDLAGFGRRAIELSPEEIVDMLIYQIGALQAIARAEGVRVSYVKPHGALYNLAQCDPEAAGAVAEAVRLAAEGAPGLALVGSPASAVAGAAEAAGVRFIAEGYADRAYEPDGRLAPRGSPGAVLTDPKEVAARAVDIVLRGELKTIDGGRLELRVQTICLHGDTPGAAALAAAVRRALEEAGVRVAAFA